MSVPRSLFRWAALPLGVALLQGCSANSAESALPEAGPTVPVACRDPRPEICTQDYRPVCAERDNGVRCVKAPCPSTDRKTYSNACAACNDPLVYSYVDGACETSDD